MDVIVNGKKFKVMDYIPFSAYKIIMRMQNVAEDEQDRLMDLTLELLKDIVIEPKVDEKSPVEDILGLSAQLTPFLSETSKKIANTIGSLSLPDSSAGSR